MCNKYQFVWKGKLCIRDLLFQVINTITNLAEKKKITTNDKTISKF